MVPFGITCSDAVFYTFTFVEKSYESAQDYPKVKKIHDIS